MKAVKAGNRNHGLLKLPSKNTHLCSSAGLAKSSFLVLCFTVSPLVDHANTAKGGRIFLNLKPASATEESARAATSVPGSTSKSYQVGQLSGKQEQVLL